ncbi:MAG TPA: adenosine deaminase [Acidimicrobiales bacterium]|nr:adenosine deaminase [Acidimicrobiales bacterium]
MTGTAVTEVVGADLIRLPKVELHLHIEGTLEPELIFALAERHGLALAHGDIEGLRAKYDFTDLADFLDLYYDNMSVLVTEADFYDLAHAYLRRASAEGVRHVEMFFDPQAHTTRGVPLQAVVEGLASAARYGETNFGVSTGLIANFVRDRPVQEAMATLDDLLGLDAPILAVGLDSVEIGHPPSKFAALFAKARAAGLRCVAHAGEEGPPGYVWEALDVLQVERVDHGVRSMEDPALVERLRETKTALTVCPLSNVKLRAFPSLAEHPLAKMLAAGLRVTVNSDDPAYFGGYISENFRQVADVFDLGRTELAKLARNAIDAAFVGAQQRRDLLAELDRWEGGPVPPVH